MYIHLQQLTEQVWYPIPDQAQIWKRLKTVDMQVERVGNTDRDRETDAGRQRNAD